MGAACGKVPTCAVMMIAIVFGRYDLTEAQKHTEEVGQSLVAPMKHGLKVVVTRRPPSAAAHD